MSNFNASTLIKLVVLSLIVGTVLAVIGVNPMGFWREIWETIVETVDYIFGNGLEAIMTALRYTLLGAVIVVPIWLLSVIFKRKEKGGSSDAKQ